MTGLGTAVFSILNLRRFTSCYFEANAHSNSVPQTKGGRSQRWTLRICLYGECSGQCCLAQWSLCTSTCRTMVSLSPYALLGPGLGHSQSAGFMPLCREMKTRKAMSQSSLLTGPPHS